jgi:hypothetical protein
MRVDQVELTDETDFAAVALTALRGGYGGTRADNYPLDWVFRAYRELAGTPWAGRLARGVAACLTHEDPMVRAQALTFFVAHPDAAGAERTVDLARGDRSLFAGVPDPMRPGHDLEYQLLTASRLYSRLDQT